jgi:hypothetical protein
MSKDITFMKLFLAGITIAENAMIYNFVSRLAKAKCECSEDWRREAITAMTAFNFISILMGLFFNRQGQGQGAPLSYSFMLMLYSAIYVTIILSYSYKLRQDKCKCAQGLDASVIYYTRAINILLVILLLTVSLTATIVMLGLFLRSKK